MTIPTFTQGYPPDGSTLGQTKATIRDNLDGTFLTLGVDHINNNGSPGNHPAGYHNVIRSVPQGSNPAPVAGYGQLFSKTINSVTTDQAMFWETGNGLVMQMTANLTPVTGSSGVTFLPGGLILQYGSVSQSFSSGSTTGTTNFSIAFPNNLFFVSGNPTYVNSSLPNSQASLNIRQSRLNSGSRSSFDWQFYTNSSSYVGFTWIAIGN